MIILRIISLFIIVNDLGLIDNNLNLSNDESLINNLNRIDVILIKEESY